MRFKNFASFCLLLLFQLTITATIVHAVDDYNDLVISNYDESRARIIMLDGHMYFHAGKNKNITFRVNPGGSILFGNTDIQKLPNVTQILKIYSDIASLTDTVISTNNLAQSATQVTSETQRYVDNIKVKLANMTNQISSLMKRRKSRGDNKLKKLITMLSENVDKLMKLIKSDECVAQPCKNGAVCIDLFAKYQCLCPSNFEGKNCETRVDECAAYSRIGQGCENNATCVNNVNVAGFTCKCPKGFHGRLCNRQKNTCDADENLCGEHGHCIPNGEGHKCLCEFGFKSDSDPENPNCIDIDECAKNPCYPGAGCVNTPGAFQCTSCPPGLIGNGYHCADFDECSEPESNGCSKNPKVDCYNTFGGYNCGPCPQGFEGDGRVCKFSGRCDPNPCHSLATCVEQPSFACNCPEGYTGTGIGPDGCLKDNSTCGYLICLNGGSCDTELNICRCTKGYSGSGCQFAEISEACNEGHCGVNGRCVVVYGRAECNCNKGFYGKRCQFQQDSCGFHTHNETGVMEYSRDVKRMELQDKACEWSIQLFDTSKVIEFRFENFTIPRLYSLTSKSCKFGFGNLSIFDGPDISRPRIGAFCHGDNLTPDVNFPFYTSGNAAKVVFNIRLHTITTYVRLTWKAVNPRCGGRYTGLSGDVSYYDVHDEDLCAFYVSVPPEYHIELTIKKLRMASQEVVNCTVNSLEVFDHQTAANRTRLTQLCESHVDPTVVRTTANYATIYFKTDRRAFGDDDAVVDCKQGSNQPWCGVGFSISYKVIETPAGCGGTLQPDSTGKMSGFITSPNYGHNYFPNLSCTWILSASVANTTASPVIDSYSDPTGVGYQVAEKERKVRVEFVDFDIATNELAFSSVMSSVYFRTVMNCNGDYVRMMPRGGVFCNQNKPRGSYSAPMFNIKFVSDSSVSARGFKIKYETVCEMDFREINGTISSPGYPAALNHPFKCTYRILADPKHAIKVTFKHIGIRADIDTCFYKTEKHKDMEDYIEFEGGQPSNDQVNKRFVCTRYPFVAPNGEIVTSGSRPLSITYSTSGNPAMNSGFSFDYDIIDVGCGGVFTSSTGVVTSPNYPNKYQSHMYCIYDIIVESNKNIRLTFDVFDVENVANQEGCGYDSVQVYEGVYVDEDNHGQLLGLFCGMSIPPSLISSSNRMSLVFSSDRSVNGAGFSASYRAVHVADDCDQTFTMSEGIIQFNATRHPRATVCNYVIALPQMHRIMLNFENVSLPCHQGSLLVKNGMSDQSPSFPGLSEICGMGINKQLITQGNRAFIRFSSSAPSLAVFTIRYEQFVSGCGGRATGVSGFISAPQYPLKDSKSLACEWKVSVAEGSRIKLSFSFIDNLDSADGSGQCTAFSHNYIDIYGGTTNDVLLKKYCTQQTATTPLFSDSNALSVKYVQHGGSFHGSLFGFLAHFRTECSDVTLTKFHGSIQSPGYPGPIDPNDNISCKWKIRTSRGSRIQVRFHRFAIDDEIYGEGCQNYLRFNQNQVSESTQSGPKLEENDLLKFCGSSVPQEIISHTNELDIEYKSNKGDASNVFWLSYTTVGCGGIILQNNTVIETNVADFTYNTSWRQCNWDIKGPVGYVVQVDIDYGLFMGDLENKNACRSKEGDGLLLFNRPPMKADDRTYLLKYLCGILQNETIRSYSNELTLWMLLSEKNIMKKPDGSVFRGTVKFVKLPFNQQTNCGGVIDVTRIKTSVKSPNYPKPYPKGEKCIWEFHAPAGHSVVFGVKNFSTSRDQTWNGYSTGNSSAAVAYLDGYIAFYRGSYIQDEDLVTSDFVYRTSGRIEELKTIRMDSQNATFVFRGNPSELPVSALTMDKPVGFDMYVWAECGGTLTAKEEAQSILFTRGPQETDITDNGNCSYRIVKDDEESEGDTVYFTLGRTAFQDGSMTNTGRDACTLTCGEYSEYFSTSSLEDVSFSKKLERCEDEMHLQCMLDENSPPHLLTYGLENNFCGGTISNFNKLIRFTFDPRKPADCEWFFTRPPGFNASITVTPIILPESENCQDSYIEVRAELQTIRTCNTTDLISVASPNVTVRLRYRVYEDTVFDSDLTEYRLAIDSGTRVDMFATLHVIESPPYKESTHPGYTWYLDTDKNNSKIKIIIEKLNMPPTAVASLVFEPFKCQAHRNCQEEDVSGFVEDSPREFVMDAAEVIVKFTSMDKYPSFRFRWEEVEVDDSVIVVGGKKDVKVDEDFTCGGDLHATYEPQILESPKNSLGNYDMNMRCRWRIAKPMFANIVIKILEADFEVHPSCAYDYVALTALKLSPGEITGHHAQLLVYCNGNSTGNPMDLEFNMDTYIYMFTDRSRASTGFKIQYELGCKAYEYVKEQDSPLSTDIISPGYPSSYKNDLNCFWGLVLGSTRQVNVTIELDIEGSDGNCQNDYLMLSTTPVPYWHTRLIGNANKKLCGRMSLRQTFESRLFVYFVTSKNDHSRPGFKMHIEEIMIDCSSNNLFIDEANPVRHLSSPEFPHMSPNSLNCFWIINTLPGHRIKFTVDPHTFNLQNSDEEECMDDYLEIRDGPSATSPLVGKYCNEYAPSTIFSTDSVLYVRYVTDSYAKSMGFNATYEIASCGGSVVLKPGHTGNVKSPNYPDMYPAQSQCDWTVKAPPGHFVEAKMNHVWMGYSENCSQEYVRLRDKNSTGDILLEPTCSKMTVSPEGYHSEHNAMFVEFFANSSTPKTAITFCHNGMCGFDLAVTSSAFSCGGLITDASGELTLPGFPDKIVRNVDCEWTFDAGIGQRYVFEFEFLNEENGFYMNSLSDHCYPDLEVFNGPPRARNNLILQHKRFCSNQTTFISMADLVTVNYADQSKNWMSTLMESTSRLVFDDRFYKPWRIKYNRVGNSFNREGCSSLITKNTVMKIGNLTVDSRVATYIGARSFCHLRVQRSTKQGTTMMQFTDVKKRPGILRNCKQGNRVVVHDPESSPWPIDEIICNSTGNSNNTTFVFPNPKIDIYVINNPHIMYFDVPIEFQLAVKFYQCGGFIDADEAQTGVITSSNFGGSRLYPKDQYCLWYLKAPEDQIVHLKFDYMDIESHIECQKDYLEIGEGQGFHSVIHRYCYGKNDVFPERFKVIRSRGRELSLLWRTDDMFQLTGWNLTYSFVHFHSDDDPACGFSSHAMSGEIISPNFPQDYPNNANCDWNIAVPLGYHILLTFDTVDVQHNCDKDALKISQEHQSRAMTPLSDYYFYFAHEQVIKTICGNDEQPPITSESNQVLVNFKSDESVSGKGFKLKWEAKCGTALTLTHGVITSPHYPNFYPNEDMQCDYIVLPVLPDDATPIVTLKILDFNLEPFGFGLRNAEVANFSLECRGDYLQIFDVSKNTVKYKLCGENMGSVTETPPISVHGAIGVLFSTNRSYYETTDKKNYRGFKISYAVADCGGEIVLNDTKEKLSTTIYSPGFPLDYHHNLDCVWQITAISDRILSIKFVAIEMEENNNDCSFDFVELFGSIVSNFSSTAKPKDYSADMSFMGRYCGESIPKDYLMTSGNNLTVRFKSDHSNAKSGFKLVVTATLGESAGCGGRLVATDEAKTLEPPLDKLHNNKYYNGLRCLWNLKAEDPQKVIEFKFTEMALEQKRRTVGNSSSCYDFVAIYDGSRSMSSFLLAPTCILDDLPFTLSSSYRMADFYFETDSNDAYDGFSVQYRQVKSECGGSNAASSESAELVYESQRGLTRTNQKHQRCRWMFYATAGEPLLIEFKEFSFPSDDPTCPFEYLEIRDVGVAAECLHPSCGSESHEKAVVRYCGRAPPARYISTTSVVQITTSILIQSQYSSSFRMNYQTLDECNRTVSFTSSSPSISGRLTSPNYPNTYDNNVTCVTTLKVPLENRILIVFNSFRLERGESTFVRHRTPGIMKFPNWRRNYLNRGHGLFPRPEKRDDLFAVGNTCSYDYLKVILNPVSTNGTSTFCGFILPPSMFTTGDELTLQLTTDASMAHGGYDLSYYTSRKPLKIYRASDGGAANYKLMYDFYPNRERSGVITPIGYPSNYPNNTNQRFTISPPSALSCRFTVLVLRTSAELEKPDCSSADHLMFSTVTTATWDESKSIDTQRAEWLKFPCSQTVVQDLQESKGLTYFFLFNTDNDNSNNGLGFRIQWTCSNYEEDIL